MHAHIINIHMECGYRVQSLIMLCSILKHRFLFTNVIPTLWHKDDQFFFWHDCGDGLVWQVELLQPARHAGN